MLFNSIDFAVFLPIVFCIYWLLAGRGTKIQNIFIIAASFIFYGWWDWRYLFLLLFASLVDFCVGIGFAKVSDPLKRKILLGVSVVSNLGLLAFFKYFNFFITNFSEAFSFFGHPINVRPLTIILPVGISFYTFQTLGYIFDVYRRKLSPATDLAAYLAYVSFFPQLVAGPIERASHMLPQFYAARNFDYRVAVSGLRQILWGLFKKIVIADNCAQFANLIFNNYASYNGSTLVLGALFFAFQIYGDFSGYSDIAIGTAKLFGFNLMRNFEYPYFSRDIVEFWRRWHISLSTWFRDYIYIPLGGNRGSSFKKIRNICIVFVVSGFWHGANWTFIAWGALNALYFLPSLLRKRDTPKFASAVDAKSIPMLKDLPAITLTFGLTVLAWVFFRSPSLSAAFNYLERIFSASLFLVPHFPLRRQALTTILLVVGFVVVEWLGRAEQFAIAKLGLTWPRPVRWLFYYALIAAIIMLAGYQQPFIYFQF